MLFFLFSDHWMFHFSNMCLFCGYTVYDAEDTKQPNRALPDPMLKDQNFRICLRGGWGSICILSVKVKEGTGKERPCRLFFRGLWGALLYLYHIFEYQAMSTSMFRSPSHSHWISWFCKDAPTHHRSSRWHQDGLLLRECRHGLRTCSARALVMSLIGQCSLRGTWWHCSFGTRACAVKLCHMHVIACDSIW